MRRNGVTALTVGVFFLVLCDTAMARPRDQVMSDAFRCGGYENTHDWLECYYGAAQSVRTVLRLSPATQRQLQLSATPSPRSAAAADAEVRDEVMTRAAGCTTIGDDSQWLDCYYAAAQPVRASLGLVPAPQAAGVTPLPGALRVYPAPGQGPARMQGYAFDSHGWFTITLDNGQVWQQSSGDTDYAHWNLPAQKYAVRFSPGFLGSINMRVIGHGGSYKVVRIR